MAWEVGASEKHSVRLDYSNWSGKVRVSVDGKVVGSKRIWGGGAEGLEFEVGEKEVHSLRLMNINYGLLFGLASTRGRGYVLPSLRSWDLSVDGKKVE